MAVPPVATGLAVRFASGSPAALAAGLAVAVFNAGIVFGFWIAGCTMQSRLGAIGPVAVGGIIDRGRRNPACCAGRDRRHRFRAADRAATGTSALPTVPPRLASV